MTTKLFFGLIFLLLIFLFGKSQIFAQSPAPVICIADINKDGVVDISDFSFLLQDFGTNNPRSDIVKSIDGTVVVNIQDFTALRNDFGKSCSQTNVKRILTIGFNPVENGQTYAQQFFPTVTNGDVFALENRVWQETKKSMELATNNFYTFELVKHLKVDTMLPYPDGFKFSFETYQKCVWGTPAFDPTYCEARKREFDYVSWVKVNKICEIAKENNIDEIWMMSLPYIMGWESFMIGPTHGIWINGGTYAVDTCDKQYAVINGTYDRPNNLMHNIGHRVESTMEYLTSAWSSQDRNLHWARFVAFSPYTKDVNPNPYCGNTHFPHNANAGYDYGNQTTQTSICADWNNFPNYTNVTKQINCTAWNCDDAPWQVFWLSSIPHREGETTLTSNTGKPFTFPNNWWKLILDPNKAMEKRKSIL